MRLAQKRHKSPLPILYRYYRLFDRSDDKDDDDDDDDDDDEGEGEDDERTMMNQLIDFCQQQGLSLSTELNMLFQMLFIPCFWDPV